MEILIVNNEINIPNNLPINFSQENNILTILPNQIFTEPVKIVVRDDLSSNFKIDVKSGVDLNLVVEYINTNKNALDANIEVNFGKNTNGKYFFICETASNNLKLNHLMNLDNDSNILQIGTFVNKNTNINWDVNLNGRGASINIQNLLISSNDESQVISCHLTHHAPNTNADMNLIGASTDQGIVKLNGIAKIEQGMKGSNAFQTLKGIILNEKAQIDVNPILIIDEFDIQAGHAATVGKVDEEQLYYLQSRGLTEEDATKLIVKGFLTPVISLIEDEVIKEHLLDLVEEKL